MIKLNIQLFGGGEDAVDRTAQADPDGDGYVIIPAPNGKSYQVPASLFSKIDADKGSKSGADEEVREAKVWMSWYLTYGTAPTNTSMLTEYGKSIGMGDREVRYNSKSDAEINYIIPGLQEASRQGQIRDLSGNVINIVGKPEGWSPIYGEPIGKNDIGQYLYRDPSSGKLFVPGLDTSIFDASKTVWDNYKVSFKDMQGNPIEISKGFTDAINSATKESVVTNQIKGLPDGYSETYGMPVAKSADGKTYIYKDPTTGMYILPGASSNPRFPGLGNVTGFTDMSGNPVRFSVDGNTMTNASTGEVIVPNTDLPEPPNGSEEIEGTGDPREEAYRSYFNRYYDDVMTTNEGTLGKQILDNNISLYEKEAENAGILADTGLQAQAMAQAQGVKQITDAVRSERMSQLRAGMSESQLADRELQMLMGSVNQMSQQAQISSQEATAAQLAASTARENAFNDYIAQATQLGQNAAANYASEVGDAYALAAKYMREAAANGQNITWDQAYQKATGATTS